MIVSIFSDRNNAEVVGNLSGDDAQVIIDVIDEVSLHTFTSEKRVGGLSLKNPYPIGQALGSLPQQIHRRCLRTLYRVCSRQALLPRSLAIPLCYDPMETPLCCGGFADVWKGQCRGQEVAAKALRVALTSDIVRIRKVCRSQPVACINGLTLSYTGVL